MNLFNKLLLKSKDRDAASEATSITAVPPFSQPAVSDINSEASPQDQENTEADVKQTSKALCPQETVEDLRKSIIKAVKEKQCVEYEIADLLWKDAASCFPGGPPWDSASFMLDLITGNLRAETSSYPGQAGLYYTSSYNLTAAEFNTIAKKYNMNPLLQSFRTKEDWKKIFDDELNSAVAIAIDKLQTAKDSKAQKG